MRCAAPIRVAGIIADERAAIKRVLDTMSLPEGISSPTNGATMYSSRLLCNRYLAAPGAACFLQQSLVSSGPQ